MDWRPSYTATAKVPFGCYVLYNELSTIFKGNSITMVEENVYDALIKRDTTNNDNYIFINDYVDFDRQETHQLLDHVIRGNTVFIASNYFSGFLADTLNIKSDTEYTIQEDTVSLEMTHNWFKSKQFSYTRGMNKGYFSSVDTLNTTILGHITFTAKDLIENRQPRTIIRPNLIKTRFGNGEFILSTTPQAYTNLYLLKGNEDYVVNTFSYLKDVPIFWDNYKKSGRIVINSPMRFVLNQAPLKWGYYLTMATVLLFVMFRAKREQRIIPVIEPLQNSSVDFSRTVGALYYQNGDHTNLIFKKINYFLEYLRNQYQVDTSQASDQLAHNLSAKSGKNVEETTALIDYIHHLKNKKNHTEEESIVLNQKITAFKH
ncbi:MAG: DUF4350 domain-containing protein [Bacteroidota bacterium]